MDETLESVRSHVAQLAASIGAPPDSLPAYEVDGMGRPYVERDESVFSYVLNERGEELDRRRTASLDELLYWIFADVTHAIASDWEVSHRTTSQDSRRRLLSMQLSLLYRLDTAWASRYRLENAQVLNEAGVE